jgi:hypothetical protein
VCKWFPQARFCFLGALLAARVRSHFKIRHLYFSSFYFDVTVRHLLCVFVCFFFFKKKKFLNESMVSRFFFFSFLLLLCALGSLNLLCLKILEKYVYGEWLFSHRTENTQEICLCVWVRVFLSFFIGRLIKHM